MPDATISSTASTFGTISGTFAADQSTVTGTITAITGSVDGSVGVPGPQGQQGIQGIQGIQGDPGSPGAPGQGVAAGGSTGQVLQKLSATSYDTGWLTLPSDFITSVSAPLAVASGVLSVDLSTYLLKSGGYMTGDIQSSNNSAYRSWDGVYNTAILKADYLQLGNSNVGGNTLTVEWDGITFADGKQTVKFPGAATLFANAALTGNPSAPTPATNDDDTSIATTAFVKAQGYLTSAPVTSVAGKVGVVTLDNTDISGLGTMATATASDYSTTVAADGLYYPLSGNPSGFLTSVPPPTLTNLTSDISWDGSAQIGRLYIAGVVDIGSGFTEGRLNFTSGVPNQPATGDFWTNGTDFFYRESGSTKTIASQTYVNAQGFITSSALTPYAPLSSPTFTGNPTAPTPATSDNDTSIATTAYVKAQAFGDRYLTSSTTSNTVSNGNKTFTIGTGLSYTPTQNITISYDASNHMHGEVLTYNSGTGVLTVDVNHHTGSGTYASWVVNVGGVTPATSVAFADITGAVSGNTNLQAALDLKSNLASPTFTGTPTLPTGTIGTTQSPGNNTTALATTAFVTAAVPAFATFTTPTPTSTTTSVSPALAMDFLMHPGYRVWGTRGSSATSGAGASLTTYSTTVTEVVGPNVLTAGYAMAIWDTSAVSMGMLGMTRGTNANNRAWNKPVYASGRGQFGYPPNATYNGDANSTIRVSVGGKSSAASGDISINEPGFGFKFTPGSAMVLQLSQGNGTSLTNVTSSFTPVVKEAFDWKIYSDGTGNVTLYINDSSVATSANGPSTSTPESSNFYFEMAEQTVLATVRIFWLSINPKIYWGV